MNFSKQLDISRDVKGSVAFEWHMQSTNGIEGDLPRSKANIQRRLLLLSEREGRTGESSVESEASRGYTMTDLDPAASPYPIPFF